MTTVESVFEPAVYASNYLVLVSESLVAQDIAMTIAEYDATAHVITAITLSDAEVALANVTDLKVAFVKARPSNFRGSALDLAISQRGARLVMLGIEAESIGPTPDFDVLSQPFDTDAVLAKLAVR